MLPQAFMNLLLNAIKAMPDGGELGVALGQADGEAWVSISDTGQGIAPGDLNNIFDPFYTTAPVGQGTGLGLSICYSIIKQHFGTISVDSEAGNGSTFTVRLPILVLWGSFLPFLARKGSGMTDSAELILIVDDEPDMCWALEHLLNQRGYVTRKALTAPEALILMERHRFACAFLDAKLPDMDGLELARRIR